MALTERTYYVFNVDPTHEKTGFRLLGTMSHPAALLLKTTDDLLLFREEEVNTIISTINLKEADDRLFLFEVEGEGEISTSRWRLVDLGPGAKSIPRNELDGLIATTLLFKKHVLYVVYDAPTARRIFKKLTSH